MYQEKPVKLRRLIPAEMASDDLLKMERRQLVSTYKFGILYATAGQNKENEMFSNGECHQR